MIGKKRDTPIENVSTCVTEYIDIAKGYKEKNDFNYNIYSISGSSEGLVPDFCEVCIDCVESGGTLRRNNLEILSTIMESDVWLIGNDNKQLSDINEILEIIRR